MTTLRKLTKNRGAAPGAARGGPHRVGRYLRTPASDAFFLMLAGTLVLVGVGCTVVFDMGWGIGRPDVIVVMFAPFGTLMAGTGVVVWIRRPRIADEMRRIDEDWPLLETALLRVVDRSSLRGRVMARLLVDYGYRTSTARRAILARFGRTHEHPRSKPPIPVSSESGKRGKRGGCGELAPTGLPAQLLHDEVNRPSRAQLLPQLRPATARVLGGGLMLFGTISAFALGIRVNTLGPGAMPGAIALAALGATVLFISGLLDARRNHLVRCEGDRAFVKWAGIVAALRDAESAGRQPSEALQQLGFREYEVRRAILRCAFRSR